jgi:hypothetical protein
VLLRPFATGAQPGSTQQAAAAAVAAADAAVMSCSASMLPYHAASLAMHQSGVQIIQQHVPTAAALAAPVHKIVSRFTERWPTHLLLLLILILQANIRGAKHISVVSRSSDAK